MRIDAPTLVVPVLGIPASGTLTNCTGLPSANVVVTPTGNIAATNVQAAITELDYPSRVNTVASATSITPLIDAYGINSQANTEATGTLTINAPSGTPADGQILELRINTTNVQTYSWNAIYRGGTTVVAPTASTAGKTDYILVQYNSGVPKWDFLAYAAGY